MDDTRYYAFQSRWSEPAEFAPLLAPLSAGAPAVVEAVAGLVLHPVLVARRGVTPHAGSGDDAESRTVRELLRRVLARDGRPLAAARAPERRFIGTCRDYALLVCSVLRHQGIPARLRVGFADYFVPGFHEDHWLCEYRDGAGWRLADGELDAATRREYGVAFEAWDVPRDRFLTAGQAWRAVRRGALAPERFGVSFIGLSGAWFVGGSVLRDLAALNKQELLPWDYWGLARHLAPGSGVPDAVAARLDALAGVVAAEPPDPAAVRAAYDGDEAVRVPAVVRSFPRGGPLDVDLTAM
ncbi:MAG: hypothetical protein A2W08_14125 [Candidatus Rokubacteria bacterium RBG_16_73_20]|nr:MAG: hypothetical protein A2050_07250 [Candidatus Rokubacteria bacterium GWA2_73_35]OGK90576.1 MAG: hypothetical protein A2W08_14125 [Candidatus Rokubacteria bacterium RBG_16_73_20]HBH02994.1 hypothetical protein [Candidatus Rokubacteria bacterium]